MPVRFVEVPEPRGTPQDVAGAAGLECIRGRVEPQPEVVHLDWRERRVLVGVGEGLIVEDDRSRGDARAEAMARLRQRARLPLVAVPAGGLVGIFGSYLYWTVSPVRVEGVPLTGRLADFGIGGVRTWSLVLALAVLAYGALVLRARSRNATQGEALARLGIGLAVLPVIWALTLVMFLEFKSER